MAVHFYYCSYHSILNKSSVISNICHISVYTSAYLCTLVRCTRRGLTKKIYALKKNIYTFSKNIYTFSKNIYTFSKNIYTFSKNIYFFKKHIYFFKKHMFFGTYIFAEKHIFFVRPHLEHCVYEKVPCKKTYVFHVHPQRAPKSMFSCRLYFLVARCTTGPRRARKG